MMSLNLLTEKENQKMIKVDATSDCIALLNQELTLPSSMSLPNLTMNAPPTFNFNQGQNIISLPTFNI